MLKMPHFGRYKKVEEARWRGENRVPHRIFCVRRPDGKCMIFLCGYIHKDKQYTPRNAYDLALARFKEIQQGKAIAWNAHSKSKRWGKLKNKAYRDAYTGATLDRNSVPNSGSPRQRKWTQAELARRSGIPQARISHIEQPGRDPLSLRTLYRLVSAFDVGLLVQCVPFSELVDREEAFHPETFTVVSFAEDALPDQTISYHHGVVVGGGAVISLVDVLHEPPRPIQFQRTGAVFRRHFHYFKGEIEYDYQEQTQQEESTFTHYAARSSRQLSVGICQ